MSRSALRGRRASRTVEQFHGTMETAKTEPCIRLSKPARNARREFAAEVPSISPRQSQRRLKEETELCFNRFDSPSEARLLRFSLGTEESVGRN